MKLFTALPMALIVGAVLVGCSESPHHIRSNEPGITVEVSHRTINVGESTRLVAHTMNIVSSSGVKWTVSPNVAKISPDSKDAMVALFSADQPATYLINAAVQRSDGQWVTSPDVTITVNGRMNPGR